jgi:hypothetical protein
MTPIWNESCYAHLLDTLRRPSSVGALWIRLKREVFGSSFRRCGGGGGGGGDGGGSSSSSSSSSWVE